jgi:hypothetical protein
MSHEGVSGSVPNDRPNIDSLRRKASLGDEKARKELSKLGSVGGKVAADRKIEKDERMLNEMWEIAAQRGDHLLPEDELPPFLPDAAPPRFRKRTFGESSEEA